jgi:crotonobetainyl-CoA:carnitine CoA-transferase CaiB-like acyl-CoA transferase
VRERTGVGQEVDLSLFNIGIYQLSFDIAGALVTGMDFKDLVPEQLLQDEELLKSRDELMADAETAIDNLRKFFQQHAPNPLVLDYETKDKRIIHTNVLQPDRYWSRVCQAIDRPDLENDPRFNSYESRVENHLDLYHILREFFESKTLDELKKCLGEAGIPFGPQQKLSEVINDPQARANDYFVPFNHPAYGRIEVVANPIRLSETPATLRMPAPEFSQHTEEVLLEIGYDWDDIAQFKQQGVIA